MYLRLSLVLCCALSVAAPAMATPGGLMWTVGQGRWACELPGDATTPPSPQPEGNFNIVPDSSYAVASGERGAYLLLGNTLTMTSGPFAGRRFVRSGGATLVRLGADGEPMALRCVRAGVVRDAEGEPPNAQPAPR